MNRLDRRRTARSGAFAVLVALMAASGASAKKSAHYSANKLAAQHSVSKAPSRYSIDKRMHRRAGRSNV